VPVEMCSGCRRSKRPELEQVLESLVAIEKLEVRSYETNALQLFVERVLDWQERFRRLCEACGEVKEMCEMVRGDLGRDSLVGAYERMSSLRRVEMNGLGLESLLLEVDVVEMRELQEVLSIVCEEVRISSLL